MKTATWIALGLLAVSATASVVTIITYYEKHTNPDGTFTLIKHGSYN